MKIVVLVHDAGGAEIISSMMRHNMGHQWTVLARRESPACQIFRRKGLTKYLKLVSVVTVQSIVKHKPEYVFLGTSWMVKDFALIEPLKKKGIRTIAFLDHWIDYKQRFGYPRKDWKKNLPNYIAVGDSVAFKQAKKDGFKNITKINNYYLLDVINNFKAKRKQEDKALVFISQTIGKNVNNNFNYVGKAEKSILTGIIENFDKISSVYKVDKLVILLHPAQTKANFLKNYKLNSKKISIMEANKNSLMENLRMAKLVVGLSGMALFISYLIGKKTVAFLPEGINQILPLPKKATVNSMEEFLTFSNNDKDNGKLNKFLYSVYPLEEFFKQNYKC